MRPCVFIHTNHKQHIGALVSAYSMRRNARNPDAFDVKLIELEDHKDIFDRYEGRELPAGTHSVAYALYFRSAERTLTDEEVDRALKATVESVSARYCAKQR